MSYGKTGWYYNPVAIQQYRDELPDSGHRPAAAAAPDGEPLAGYWSRLVARGFTGVFLQDAEQELFGKHHPAQGQQRGTCVSQSMKRAVEDSLWAGIAWRGQIAVPVRFCFETIYPGSRVNVGRGQLGSNDGSFGAWAAKYVHDYGLLPVGKYGNIDLTRDQEELSCEWGEPGVGVPKSLLEVSASYKVQACYFPKSTMDIADALAAGYASQRCANLIYGKPDSDGIAQPDGDDGHAQEYCGVFLDENGELCFVEQQSWNYYPGPVTLRFAGGEKELRQGSYGVKAKQAWSYTSSSGEVWSVGGVHAPRPTSTEDAIR